MAGAKAIYGAVLCQVARYEPVEWGWRADLVYTAADIPSWSVLSLRPSLRWSAHHRRSKPWSGVQRQSHHNYVSGSASSSRNSEDTQKWMSYSLQDHPMAEEYACLQSVYTHLVARLTGGPRTHPLAY